MAACNTRAHPQATPLLFCRYYLTLVALLMLAVELVIRWGACDGVTHADGLGQKRFGASNANVFDVVTCVFVFVSTVALLLGASRGLHEDATDVLEVSVARLLLSALYHGLTLQGNDRQMSRGFMVVRLLSTFHRFRAFVKLLGGIVTITLRFAVLYGCLTYAFAVTGMAMFAYVCGVAIGGALPFATIAYASLIRACFVPGPSLRADCRRLLSITAFTASAMQA